MTEDRVVVNPDICNGKPTIRGTRITVQTILEFLSAGEEVDEILRQYPSLTRADIYACLHFASHLMEHRFAQRVQTGQYLRGQN